MTTVVNCSTTVWSGLWSGQESNNSAISIDQYFFKRIIWKMDKISPSFTVVYFDASKVDLELICVVVALKSCCTHRVNILRRIQLSLSWIGNQALSKLLKAFILYNRKKDYKFLLFSLLFFWMFSSLSRLPFDVLHMTCLLNGLFSVNYKGSAVQH